MLDMISGCHKTNRKFPLPPGEGQGEGASIRQLAIFDPRSPTLPRRGRENVGQQWVSLYSELIMVRDRLITRLYLCSGAALDK